MQPQPEDTQRTTARAPPHHARRPFKPPSAGIVLWRFSPDWVCQRSCRGLPQWKNSLTGSHRGAVVRRCCRGGTRTVEKLKCFSGSIFLYLAVVGSDEFGLQTARLCFQNTVMQMLLLLLHRTIWRCCNSCLVRGNWECIFWKLVSVTFHELFQAIQETLLFATFTKKHQLTLGK